MAIVIYEVTINGLTHRFQLPDGAPLPAGARIVGQPDPDEKQRQPANKSHRPNNKGPGGDRDG